MFASEYAASGHEELVVFVPDIVVSGEVVPAPALSPVASFECGHSILDEAAQELGAVSVWDYTAPIALQTKTSAFEATVLISSVLAELAVPEEGMESAGTLDSEAPAVQRQSEELLHLSLPNHVARLGLNEDLDGPRSQDWL